MLRGREGGGYRVDRAHPLAAVSDVNAVLWGDYDNDGLVDAYLCRRGPNQLWRQAGKDNWQDVTAASGTAGGDLDTVDGAFFDADHDGDLDLYLVNCGWPQRTAEQQPRRQLQAAGAGTRDRCRRNRFDYGAAGRSRQRPRHRPGRAQPGRAAQVYLNDRLWSYHEAPGFDAFNSTPALSVLAEDIDADGETELYMLTRAGELLRWRRAGDGRMQAQSLARPAVVSGVDRAQLISQDVDGDGVIDLIVSSVRGWTVLAVGDEALHDRCIR